MLGGFALTALVINIKLFTDLKNTMKKTLLALAIALTIATPALADELLAPEDIHSIADIVNNGYIRNTGEPYHDGDGVLIPANDNANIYHIDSEGITHFVGKGFRSAKFILGSIVVDNETYNINKLLWGSSNLPTYAEEIE